MTNTVKTVNATHSTISGKASRQFKNKRRRQQQDDKDEGGEMLAEERQPQPPQRVGAGQHHLHLPAGMRAGMIGERQLQHVLEIIRQHHVAALMGQPVGVPGDERGGDDHEQAEADPERRPAAPARAPPARRRPAALPTARRRCGRTAPARRIAPRRARYWPAPASAPVARSGATARERGGRCGQRT